MRVDTNSELSRVGKVRATTPPRRTPTDPNTVDLSKTDALDAALKSTPDVRAELVARAKLLIQDPGYPSDKVVNQVAGVLAKRIHSKE